MATPKVFSTDRFVMVEDAHGQTAACAACSKKRPLSELYADRFGRPFVDYYCEGCLPPEFPVYKSAAFGDIFDDYRVLTDADKVRKNSRDDYGLGAGWYFVTVKLREGKFVAVFGKLRADLAELVQPLMYSRERDDNPNADGIESVRLYRQHSGPNEGAFSAIVSDRLSIASRRIADVVTDIPADVEPLL